MTDLSKSAYPSEPRTPFDELNDAFGKAESAEGKRLDARTFLLGWQAAHKAAEPRRDDLLERIRAIVEVSMTESSTSASGRAINEIYELFKGVARAPAPLPEGTEPPRFPSGEAMCGSLELLGIIWHEDMVEEGEPWEVIAEPEPQFFETLDDAVDFYRSLQDNSERRPLSSAAEPSEDYELGRHEGILFAVDEFLADDDETYTQVAQRLMLLVENEAAKRESELLSPGAQPPSAVEWLASRGLADLSLYWPTDKPLPKTDYESGEAQPTLTQLMERYAAERTSAVAPGMSASELGKQLCAGMIDNLKRSGADRAAAPVEVPRDQDFKNKFVGVWPKEDCERCITGHGRHTCERAASGNPSKGEHDRTL